MKKLGELKEAASKSTETLLGYEAARAEALGKLSLPSSTTTVTKSTGATTTDGKKEDKSSETTEEKQSTTASGPVSESRVAAVAAVDTLYYSKSRVIFSDNIVSLIAVMDFIDKNKEKLVEPKGKSGSSNFSMY